MIQLSFPTQKLKKYITRINIKLKDTDYKQDDLTVYGVTNKEGITITGNQASDDLSNYLILKENEFAYNPYRVNVGSLGLAPKKFIGLVSPAYIVFKTTEKLNAEFLYYYLKSSLGLNLIKWYGDRGGVRSALRYNDLCEIDIPGLSLEQQIILLNKMKLINVELGEFNNEIIYQEEKIFKLRQSILQEAVQGKLVPQDPNDESASVLLQKIKEEKKKLIKERKLKKEEPLPPITEDGIPFELPKGWGWVRLGEVTSILRGSSPRPKGDRRYFSEAETSYHWITISDITNFSKGNILYKTREYLTLEGSLKSTYVRNNEIIIAVSGSTAGKSCITGIDGYIYDGLGVIRLFSKGIHEKYLELFIKQLYIFINNSKVGSAFPNINTDKLKKIMFPLPPLNEQKLIIQKVNQLMSLCNELEKNMEQSRRDSELLMQALLQQAFKDTGEADVEISLGEFIKQKRKDKGITVTDMLKLLEGVKSSEYTKIEEGLVKPEKVIVEKIAEVLKLSEIEMKSFKKLKIKANMDEYSGLDHEFQIAARRVKKN